MNRRIYFQDKYIEFSEGEVQKSHNQEVKIYGLEQKMPAPQVLARQFCNAEDKSSILLVNQDFEKTISQLKKHFYFIEAAGGLIENIGTWLFIRRHDRWDLPKGKLEEGESVSHAAVRECQEECGVKNIRITRELSPTYHIYAYKDGFALKKTYWFYMQTEYAGKLQPQLDEHITEVLWFTRKEVTGIALKDTYYTIADVVREGLSI
jgi:ADP-ribose pyrophosphatase YjhB (NUDIX family)